MRPCSWVLFHAIIEHMFYRGWESLQCYKKGFWEVLSKSCRIRIFNNTLLGIIHLRGGIVCIKRGSRRKAKKRARKGA